jgi:hypothetical protein
MWREAFPHYVYETSLCMRALCGKEFIGLKRRKEKEKRRKTM